MSESRAGFPAAPGLSSKGARVMVPAVSVWPYRGQNVAPGLFLEGPDGAGSFQSREVPQRRYVVIALFQSFQHSGHDGGEASQHGDLLVLGQFHCLVGDEFFHHHVLSPGVHGGHGEVQTGDVEHGQHVEVGVGVCQRPGRNKLHVGRHDVSMGQHRPSWIAFDGRRVDDAKRVVVGHLGQVAGGVDHEIVEGLCPAVVFLETDHVFCGYLKRAAFGNFRDFGKVFLVHHQDGRRGILENVSDFFRGKTPVHRGCDGAQRGGGAEDVEEFLVVQGQDPDPVSLPHALGSQPRRQGVDFGKQLLVGRALLTAHNCRAVAVEHGVFLEDIVDGKTLKNQSVLLF